MDFIDLTAFRCPIPLVKVKMLLKDLSAGSQLTVLLSDHGSRSDVPNFLKKQGHCVQSSVTEQGHLLLEVRVRE